MANDEVLVPNVRHIVKGLGGDVLETKEAGVVAFVPSDAAERLPGALAYLAATLPAGLSVAAANRSIRPSGFLVVREALLRDVMKRYSAPGQVIEELANVDVFRLVFHPRASSWLRRILGEGVTVGTGSGWAQGDVVVVEDISQGTPGGCFLWRAARTQAELAWNADDEDRVMAHFGQRGWVASAIFPVGEAAGLDPLGRLAVRFLVGGEGNEGLGVSDRTFTLLVSLE